MAQMPRGEPQSVPDPEGELYDQSMAGLRAKRVAEEQGESSSANPLVTAFREFQRSKPIPRPSLAATFIPVVGPLWEAGADLEDGNYLGAAVDGASAVADAVSAGVAVKGLRAASKGIGILKDGSVTADAARKVLRRVGMAGPGEEIHHTIPLNGLSRNAQSWKNNYAFLKTLPKEQHRRLTGSWNGKPMYDPIRRFWYGTADWMKAYPAQAITRSVDALENLMNPDEQQN